ncbi:ISMca4 transposase [Actinomyces sp. oral taxon 180 str. F0310]|nr:ISMca4 transposase [Actinomyces sp. oral taxon 180 str. F0310]
MTMRKFSKHTPELIVVKLERAEALRCEGMSTAQACRVLGISEATLCRWRGR